MKIYCILFDTLPQHPRIEKLFKSKKLHYSDYITNSCTVPTVVSMLSGKTPSEMRSTGIGASHTYVLLSEKEQEEWNKKILFDNLPKDWKIHLHSMPETRGDGRLGSWPMYKGRHPRLLPDDICGRNDQMKFYDYSEGSDEKKFIKKMQSFSSDENHFVFLKYNHFHDRERGKHEDVVSIFIDIIKTIDFKEKNSLFWLFADHGEPGGIDKMMSPPMSWLSWVSVTDNITNKKVTKNKIAAVDFKNTVLNRIYKRGSLGQLRADRLSNDVLSPVDKDRIYVAEDGRSNVDEYNCTTVSAIKCLGESRFIQLVHHSPKGPKGIHISDQSVTRIYDKRCKEGETLEFSCSMDNIEIVETDSNRYSFELLKHLITGPWRWYFTNE